MKTKLKLNKACENARKEEQYLSARITPKTMKSSHLKVLLDPLKR